ncbi:putative disease resistance protein RGA3 [Typha angustifolia]|uniref:putative disease resistance protein RGA3 n=1 Tax=Typha angustifolia TaxID=59011 RepID=UPI003C3048B6
MAELALASAILKPVIEKLSSEIWKQLELLWGLDGDLNKLKGTLENINNVLHVAEKKSITDPSVGKWLQELKNLAYDADDALDDFQVESLRRSGHHHPIAGKVRDFFSADNQLAFRYKVGKQIKKINERIKEIDENKNRFQFPVISEVSVNTGSLSYSGRETFLANDNQVDELYGRGEDKEKIISFLVETDNDKMLSILPIVGLGGVGKTSLVQMVLKDERIKEAFRPPSSPPPIWVCISEEFSVKEIAGKIIECVAGEKCHLSAIEPMRSRLSNLIGGRKILLVLDDVWNEDVFKWEDLKSLISYAGLGSKVIVTTRSDEVARIMRTTNSHRLDVLEFEYCWKLFSHRAFQIGTEMENPRLADIGKEIVKKCGGVPLAAKALGSLMSSRRREDEWVGVRDNEIWELSRNDQHNQVKILPALGLSYEHLPSYLKQCFIYCSLFPKDYVFDVEELIQLWIGEGFISSSSRGEHPEATGRRYFNSLLQRSFFQEEDKDELGDVRWCKMHDLIHDLACYIVGPEFSVRGRTVEEKDKCRYLSVDLSVPPETMIEMDAIAKAKKLRSFISVRWTEECNINLNILSGFLHLRVLRLRYLVEMKALPSSIARLKHLRHLDLSNNNIQTLPESITRLRSLQILKLADCFNLQKLPQGIKKMINLKTLDISNCFNLDRVPPGMGRLTKLETLSLFVAGSEPGCSILELRQLNVLRGKLEIRCLHEVKDAEEANLANLSAKTRLQSLTLNWGLDDQRGKTEDVKNDVLESLQPPPFLKVLKIYHFDGNRLPSWMTGGIQSLVEVALEGLRRCECLPPLGNLPHLKSLSVSGMSAVTEIGRGFYGDRGSFPSLENLTLDEMPLLENWCTVDAEKPSEIATFPRLSTINIWECPLLKVQPCLPPTVTTLRISNSNVQVLSATSLRDSSKLKSLYIRGCQLASSESNGWDGLSFLTALEELGIDGIPDLASLPASIIEPRFPSPRTMQLGYLPSFTSLGMDLESQEETPPFCFATLQHLEINSCNRLTALPKWLGCLTSLQNLYLQHCKNLAALPEGLQHATSLKELNICNCPLLVSRCEREQGEDWHKIAHVPNLRIF